MHAARRIVEGIVAIVNASESIRAGESAACVLRQLQLLTYGGGPLPPNCAPILDSIGVTLCCTCAHALP
jgi:hypothetical protein